MAKYLDLDGLSRYNDKVNTKLSTKAEVDGYYEELTSGNAEQLLATTLVEDTAPYVFRTTGGSLDVGDRCNMRSLVGGSVVWNQLVDTNTTSVTIESGHKYISKINSVWAVAISDGTAITVDGSRQDMIIDITAELGTTIANYIYTLEQNTSGSGVAWFRKYFPNVYYGYSAPTIQSTKVSGKKVVGFNAYNNTTGKAKLLGGNLYQITGTYTALSYSTGETITPDSNGKFTPTNNGELTVTGGNATDTCVHLVWDGERDGEYEPYKSTTYDLSSSHLVKRKYALVDLGTLDWNKYSSGANYWYVNLPDMVTPTGSRTQTLLCDYYSCCDTGVSFDDTPDKSIYTVPVNVARLCIKDDTAYSVYTEEQFKTFLSGKYLVYPLATETTETVTNPTLYGIWKLDANNNLYFDGDSIEDFQNLQIVDDFGTEEFIDSAVASGSRDVALPAGHETDYYPNLRAKLEMSPNAPDSNGDYLMRHNNGVNTYVEYTSPIPAVPSGDGTYTFKATRSGTTITYNWVAD